ncbi:hypothetical protein BDB01DRAFT_775094 [Pilobolus umbonatus]|nr:hypothetical protein BDB01DRAFT_775094 [Pilobolus umbonatus]
MKKINDTTGTIDILVNNAGAPAVGALLDIDMEVATQCINTNLFGTLAMCKAVGPSMIKRGKGKIVNVGSIMAYAGTPWAGIYCASKAALHSMTDSLRLELQPFGVQVIVVAPGAITSNFGTAGAKLVKVPEDSFYASVTNYIVARAGMSQDSSTPTDVFATHVTRKVLSSNPPHYITYGSKSTIFWFLYYAPSYIRDMIFYKRFGLDLVNK